MPDYHDDLRLAHVLADAADAATMGRFKALDLKVETKPDMTPVSEADKAAEELIRGNLQRARPRDAVLGEEYGIEGTGPRRWVIDPIDGTKNYVRGVPVWATLISLMVAGEGGYEPVVGVVSAPALARRWWAAKGGGAYSGRSLSSATRLRVSKVSRIADASFARVAEGLGGAGPTRRVPGSDPGLLAYARVRRFLAVHDGRRGLGGHLRGAGAVPVGHGGAVGHRPGGGGRFTGLDGRAGPHSGNAAASNGVLHEELLGYLNQRY